MPRVTEMILHLLRTFESVIILPMNHTTDLCIAMEFNHILMPENSDLFKQLDCLFIETLLQ